MLYLASRRRLVIAGLLLVPLLLLAAAPGAHEDHGCRFDKGCPACRWVAESAAETALPCALAQPVDAFTPAAAPPRASLADGASGAASSRGPPLA